MEVSEGPYTIAAVGQAADFRAAAKEGQRIAHGARRDEVRHDRALGLELPVLLVEEVIDERQLGVTLGIRANGPIYMGLRLGLRYPGKGR